MMKPEDFAIVEVFFGDPCLANGWTEPNAAVKDSFSKCRAAGYLLDVNEERLQIALAITADESQNEVNGIFSIPVTSVTDIKVLKKGSNGDTVRRNTRSSSVLRPKRGKGSRKADTK